VVNYLPQVKERGLAQRFLLRVSYFRTASISTRAMSSVEANVTRFNGGEEFTSTYNVSRPTPPLVIRDILNQLARQDRPKVVVDLGCGTGLSTRIWYDYADLVIGVDPSDDMREQAEAANKKLNLDESKIKFIKGDSGKVNLESGTVDIVTCSQSLHWMEPTATFNEVSRLLGPGGVFAAIDCDWPPVINGEAELLYVEAMDKVSTLGKQSGAYGGVNKWEKEGHLKRIKESEKFRYSREVLVHSVEKGDANRLIGLGLSMGSCGTLLRKGITLEQLGFPAFKLRVEESMGGKVWDWYMSYRVRVGIK